MLWWIGVKQCSPSELASVQGGVQWGEAHEAGKDAAWDRMVDIIEGGRELGESAGGRTLEPFGALGGAFVALFAGGGSYAWNAGKNVASQLRE